jgi:hypothetical protein
LDFEPKNPQVLEDQSQVLASTAEDQVDGIAHSFLPGLDVSGMRICAHRLRVSKYCIAYVKW